MLLFPGKSEGSYVRAYQDGSDTCVQCIELLGIVLKVTDYNFSEELHDKLFICDLVFYYIFSKY